MILTLFSFFALFSVAQPPPAIQETTQEYPVRSGGALSLSNLYGELRVRGWNQDKIRIKVTKKLLAGFENESPARDLPSGGIGPVPLSNNSLDQIFSLLGVRYLEVGKRIEINTDYGKGLAISRKLDERKEIKVHVDLDVFAPNHLQLRLLGGEFPLSVSSWRDSVEVRSIQGGISVNDVSAAYVHVHCAECAVKLTSIRASMRCLAGTKDVTIENWQGSDLYVETESGNQWLKSIKGKQLFVTRSGKVTGKGLQGRIEFKSQDGEIDLTEARGFASGKTLRGNISLEMKEWRFDDRAFLESEKGNISLKLPARFSGNLDLFSGLSTPKLAFQLFGSSLTEDTRIQEKDKNRVMGRVAEGGEELRIMSSEGSVQVLKSL